MTAQRAGAEWGVGFVWWIGLVMNVAEVLSELRALAEAFGFSKLQVFILILISAITLRLPTILRHWREMYAMKANDRLKQSKLEIKLAKERQKRQIKK